MTDQEWESICFLIEEWWPPNPAEGDFDAHRRSAWRLALDGFDAQPIATAVRALLMRGGKWRPKVAEVVAELRRDASQPTFDEALELIRVCLRARTEVRKARWEPGERERLNDAAATDRSVAPDMHRLIAPFLARQGGPSRLRAMGLWDEGNEYREARRKALRDRWEEFCDVVDGREVAELASGQRRGEIGRFDPLASLGRSPTAQLEAGSEA